MVYVDPNYYSSLFYSHLWHILDKNYFVDIHINSLVMSGDHFVILDF